MAQENLHAGKESSLTLAELSELRKNAEAHLDLAQEALFDDTVTDEDALSHLDAALACVSAMMTGNMHESSAQAA